MEVSNAALSKAHLEVIDSEGGQYWLLTNLLDLIRTANIQFDRVNEEEIEAAPYVLNLGVEGYILRTDDMSAVVRSIEEIAVGERRFSPGLTPVST